MRPRKISIDLETFSSVDLLKSGLYKYVQAPDFGILLAAYAYDDGPVLQTDFTAGEELPQQVLADLFNPEITKKAWNATFEWYCLSKHYNVHQPLTWIPQWHDTMIEALYTGYPGKLAMAGPALGIPEEKQKMAIGKALIRYFCVPCAPTKRNGFRTRNLPQHDPEKWADFKEYNRGDVITERAIGDTVAAFPVPESEWRLWQLDQEINARGVRVERRMINGAQFCSKQVNRELIDEACSISGLQNPNSRDQLLAWINTESGDDEEDAVNLKKDTVAKLLKTTDDEKIKRILEIRQLTSKTSIKKFDAMEHGECTDGRVRGLTQFYGANRTGRWAGRFVQAQNLPKKQPKAMDMARGLVMAKNLPMLRFMYPSVPDVLSQLIRSTFIPADGFKFVVADFSAIEARVIAWLAGESWRQKVFAGAGKIYEASASAMFGVPIETIGLDENGNDLGNYALRQKGKVAELALGYNGGVGALIAMGALDMGLKEEELPDIIRRWRKASPRICDLWYACDRAAIDTIRTGRTNVVRFVAFSREIDEARGRDFLTIQLPSGRKLYYDHPRLTPGPHGDRILYHGVHQKSHKWGVLDIYGGKFVENITQAIARDCLAITLQRLSAAAFRPVFHVHDEVISEAALSDTGALQRALDIMATPIPWAPGLILRADGFEAAYYHK